MCTYSILGQMASKVHDPLFHYETHFPERLSRLHLTPDLGPQSPQRRNRRTRSSRQDIRYKTQPVTFDEIQEVDEENIQDDNNIEGIRQFQAFSRSMDGLIPKVSNKSEKPKTTRSQTTCAVGRLHEILDEQNKENNNDNSATSPSDSAGNAALPPTGLSRDPRRQRMTAKAKRRQMMAEAREGE